MRLRGNDQVLWNPSTLSAKVTAAERFDVTVTYDLLSTLNTISQRWHKTDPVPCPAQVSRRGNPGAR